MTCLCICICKHRMQPRAAKVLLSHDFLRIHQQESLVDQARGRNDTSILPSFRARMQRQTTLKVGQLQQMKEHAETFASNQIALRASSPEEKILLEDSLRDAVLTMEMSFS